MPTCKEGRESGKDARERAFDIGVSASPLNAEAVMAIEDLADGFDIGSSVASSNGGAVAAIEDSEEMIFARLDLNRRQRQGIPEVIWAQDKTSEQLVSIGELMLLKGQKDLLMTRVSAEKASVLHQHWQGRFEYYPLSRLAVLCPRSREERGARGHIAVVSAGSSDLPVAEEAAQTAEWLGNKVSRYYDLGVSGLHRLLSQLEVLRQARVLVVVAGMEGALPSVVGGLLSAPLIAVPSSIGYGSHFGGLSALLAMLNSCTAGVTVVNIDNGFGAAVAASRINQLAAD